MSNKVFVGGLSWGTKENGLEMMFSELGEVVSVKIITDRETGRSRGFGFVEYANSEDAASAVEKLDGIELDGRSLKVSIAQERAPRNNRNENRGGYNNRW